MAVRDRVGQLWRWIAARPPFVILLAGWVAFFFGSYPGYLDRDGALQLSAVRFGDYGDATSPIMTAMWKVLELVVAGPFAMLALQSGLLLFGAAAILRTRLTPRAAAVSAVAVLLAPPVFAPMAVIWPDSLLAGAVLAACALALGPSSRAWRIAGAGALVVACSCRPEIVLALVPIVVLAVPHHGWRRVAIALGVVIAIAAVARVGDRALTDTPTYTWQQRLMLPDVVGTLRRAHVTDARELDGLSVVDAAGLAGHESLNWLPLAFGPNRMFDPITTDDQAASMRATWERVIARHPSAYLSHRATMLRNLVGISAKWSPIYDDYGDLSVLVWLHHRASPSDWQLAMRAFVRAVAITPLFRPLLYLVVAIGLLAWQRRDRMLRTLLASGLIYELTLFVFAPAPEYRYSHWLITTTSLAVVALAVGRRWRRI